MEFSPEVLELYEDPECDRLMDALRHAGEVRHDPKVVEILQRVGDTTLLDGYADGRIGGGFCNVFATLERAGEATQDNLELIFGNIKHIRRALFQLTGKPGPPYQGIQHQAGSPLDIMMKHHAIPQEEQEKRCDHCYCLGCEPGVSLKVCAKCRQARYCGRECQLAAWVIHRPQCMRAQGKVVPENIRKAADEALAVERRQQALEAEIDAEESYRVTMAAFNPHTDGTYNCGGDERMCHLPWNGMELANKVATSLGIENRSAGVIMCFSHEELAQLNIEEDCVVRGNTYGPDDGKQVAIFYEKLFEDFGTGPQCGVHIIGHFTKGPDQHLWTLIENSQGSTDFDKSLRLIATKSPLPRYGYLSPPPNFSGRFCENVKPIVSLSEKYECCGGSVEIALHPTRAEMAVSMSSIHTVVFFSTETLKPLTSLRIEYSPGAMAYDPVSDSLIVVKRDAKPEFRTQPQPVARYLRRNNGCEYVKDHRWDVPGGFKHYMSSRHDGSVFLSADPPVLLCSDNKVEKLSYLDKDAQTVALHDNTFASIVEEGACSKFKIFQPDGSVLHDFGRLEDDIHKLVTNSHGHLCIVKTSEDGVEICSYRRDGEPVRTTLSRSLFPDFEEVGAARLSDDCVLYLVVVHRWPDNRGLYAVLPFEESPHQEHDKQQQILSASAPTILSSESNSSLA
mmetsp:Transcript_23624/g.37678  ORF Transcript_23624/g.37678 Transcript_23624/m.37678 type:complete len:679 (-) Transcript_23624:2874-4910(-)